MIKVQIHPAWLFGSEAGLQLEPKLLTLLDSVQRNGKLSIAAREADLSYRHAWGILVKWQDLFRTPLVELQRGRGATLTPFGEKLLQAAQRIEDRLAPQLQSLSAEMESALNTLLTEDTPALRIHASNDLLLTRLRPLLGQLGGPEINLQFKGSVDSLVSLSKSRCDIAGFHVPAGAVGQTIAASYRPWLKPRLHKLVLLAQRQQGLILAPGNPLHIHDFKDIAERQARFINRQPGSGTRLLVDCLLAQQHMTGAEINGYETEEFTHFAVAATVASGSADAGFGVEAAARQFGLDYLPLLKEDYYLAMRQDALEQPLVQSLLAVLRSDDFRQLVAQLPGYDVSQAGRITPVREALPGYPAMAG